MSHYTKVKTKLANRECLIKALNDLGFSNEHMRVSDTAQQLEGYENRLRDERAEIILPRRFVGGASNDIGFKLQEDGTYGAIISDYDRGNSASAKNERTKGIRGYNDQWLKKLTQRYTYHKVKEQLSSQGFFIEEETEENGEIHIKANAAAWGG